MEKGSFIDTLCQLCELRGISGQEQNVSRYLFRRLKSKHPETNVDRFGNVYLTLKGQGTAPHLMLVAHIDQVGGIVSGILQNGMLRFRTVGNISASSLPATRVYVDNLPGTISTISAHMANAGQLTPPDLLIDVGAESKKEALKMGVDIGSQVTFAGEFVQLTENRVLSQSIDNRVGCAILLHLINEIDAILPGNLTLSFSTREETTMSGAFMLAQQVKPDCAIAIDTVPTDDIFTEDPVYSIGKGPVIQLAEGVMQAFVGNCIHPGIKSLLINVAKNVDIPVQKCAEINTWSTDGATLHLAQNGIPTGYLSIPRRYSHSPSEVMDLRDASHAIKLLKAFIMDLSRINLDFIS